MIRPPLIASLLALGLVALTTPSASGQTFTWSGGSTTSDNWSDGANWGGSAPVSDAANTLIVLDGTARLTNIMDLLAGGGAFDVNSLTFASGAGAFVVNPTPSNVTILRIAGGGITVASNNNQRLAVPIALGATHAWTNNGTGTFTVAGAVDLGANVLTVGGPGATTVSGVVSGTGGLTKTGAGVLTLGGANSYSGVTTISGGVLATPTLVNGGVNSGIGASPNAAANLVLDGGALRYTGGAASTDRAFTLTQNGGTIESSGTGAINFANPGAVAFAGSGARTLTLAGSNTGANIFTPVIADGAGGATSLVKSGSGLWVMPTANSYTGPTTVTAGTLAVNRTTAGTTPVGTGTIMLNGGTLAFLGTSASPLTVTGFTQDVVMSVNDFSSPFPFGITSPIDAPPGTIGNENGGAWALYEVGANPLAPTQGLPTSRQFVSAANPLTSYRLAPYDGGPGGVISNNSLLLSSDTGVGKTGTLNIDAASQGQYQTISVLVTSGSAASTFDAVLRFSDNSTTTVTGLTAPDWFNGNPFAITNLGRITTDGIPRQNQLVTGNPRLYPVDIGLSAADQAKTLTSVQFTHTSTNGRLNIFGISGAAPGGQASYANPVTLSASSTIQLVNTGSLELGPLSIGNFTLSTSGPANSRLFFPTGSLTGNPTFNVANQTLTLGPLDYGSAARTVTKSGVGTLVLGGAAVNATATNQLTVSNGIATITNATALGTAPNLSVTGGTANLGPVTSLTNATVSGGTANLGSVATVGTATLTGGTMALGGATSVGQLTGTGGTVALGSNTLTLGTANQSDTFGGVFTGAGSVVKQGTGTQTLTSAGSTFSGGLTVGTGKVAAIRPGSLGTGVVTIQDGTALILGGLPGATILGFGGTGTGWNLQGGATVAGDVLTLTTPANDQTRSAWFTTKQATTAFTASFDYSRFGGSANPADGATFTIQNESATALGGGGGLLGYGGTNGAEISPSVALLINIYQNVTPAGRGIKVVANGAGVGGPYTAVAPVDLFNSGTTPVTFNLSYDGTNLDITLTQGANTFTLLDQPFDLPALGANAWVGFTGATGGLNTNQTISNFRFNRVGDTPPPVSTYVNAVNVPGGASSTINPAVAAGGVTTFTMGPLSMGAGSTLNLAPETGSLTDAAYNLTLGATTLSGTATFNVANNGTGAGNLTLGALGDGGTARIVNKAGAGTLTLNGAAASLVNGTEVNVNTGTLRVTNATALGNQAAVAVLAGANLSLGANQTVGALTGTGNVALNGNTLTVGSGNNLSGVFEGVIANGTAAGGLTKGGTGMLTLTGANTYTGPTAVNAGNLRVTGSLANTPLAVGTGGTLSGTGTVGGTVAVATGGTLSPGASVGTLTAAGAVTINGGTGSTWVVEVNGNGSSFPPPANTPNDRLALTGTTSNLNLVVSEASRLTLSILPIDGFAWTQTTPVSYTIATKDPAAAFQVNGSAFYYHSAHYNFQVPGYPHASDFLLAVSGDQLVLTFTPVPEPGTVLAVAAAGLAGLGAVRRRYRARA